ncbi:MAG TPA: alginate export family protein [Enterobacteriaceae bacterium]|nr:alginate export family protein [Enterobacteriaceae bacterium]
MMRHVMIMLAGFSLLPMAGFAGTADASSDPVFPVTFEGTAKIEAVNLRNKNLRAGDKRENELELEPLLRFDIRVMPDSPVYGRAELEWKRQTKRESGERPEKQTRLEVNQAYIGLKNDLIPDTRVKMGRWLYRDEREWLVDENLDGAWIHWRNAAWSADAFAGRVNFWQKDLMDSTTRNTQSVNIMGLLARYQVAKRWRVGAYGVVQNNVSDDSFRLGNFGLRSHNARDERLQHWLEIGIAEGNQQGERIRGYALDMGGTLIFPIENLKPRLTLGYAVGSENYRQTGLQSNEAKFGGETKFKIYGETLNPNLANLQVLTLGLGASIGDASTLDLIYHDYSQFRLGALSEDDMALRPRYDRQNGRRLGYGLDLIYGWEPLENLKLESKLGTFTPSSRFAAGSKSSSPRSQPAYSAAVELDVSF